MLRATARILGATAALVTGIASSSPAAVPGANGPISYRQPDPEADLAFLQLFSPSAARLPAWARSWRLSEEAERFAPDLRSVVGSFSGRRGNGLRVATAPARRRWITVTRPRTDNFDGSPRWAPDGRSLVFDRYLRARRGWIVATVDVRSRRVRRLGPGRFPVWGAGGRIAFRRDGTRTAGIWTMDARGGDRLRVTTGSDDWSHDFSPDGERIVFERKGDIYVVAADGGVPARVAAAADDPAVSPAGYSDPVFSPDGKQIAYSTGASITTRDAATGGHVNEFECALGLTCFSLDWLPAPPATDRRD